MQKLQSWFPDIETLESLKMFHVELLKFNKSINLISRNTVDQIELLHFADSLMALEKTKKYLDLSDLYDIGSGNGFPGVIAALTFSDRKVSLVESDLRKCEFLKHIAFKLEIKNMEVLHRRFEELYPLQIDQAFARAFAPISRTLTWGEKVLSKKAKFYHFKGENWRQELEESQKKNKKWKTELLEEYLLPEENHKRAILCSERV